MGSKGPSWIGGGDRHGMLAGEGQLVLAVVQQAAAQGPRVGAKTGAAAAGFDRDFSHRLAALNTN